MDETDGQERLVDSRNDDYYLDETAEFFDDYGPAKLHPVHFGDILSESRYKILRKLGAGAFSTVWLARDRGLRPLPNQSGEIIERGALQKQTNERGRYPLWMAKAILRQTLLGIDFMHKSGIAHGDLQPGNILFSVQDLSSLSEDQLAQMDKQGLDFVRTKTSDGTVTFNRPTAHSVDDVTMINSISPPETQQKPGPAQDIDCKMETKVPRYIAMKQPMFDYIDLEPPLLLKISDLGGAFVDAQPPAKPVTPLGLRSPELILGEPINQAQDIWSFGCLMFEYITGRMMFSVMPPLPGTAEEERHMLMARDDDVDDVANATEVEEEEGSKTFHGPPEDEERGCIGISRDGNTNDEDDGYIGGSDDDTDDDHVLQLAATLGPLPLDFRARYPRSSLHFNEEGQVTKDYVGSLGEDQNASDIETLPSLEVFFDREKGADLGDEEASTIKSLLRTILRVDAGERPSAAELVVHPWFAEPNISVGWRPNSLPRSQEPSTAN
ncbi:hypothetical protein P7C71_g1685, partial [Lecanoromycetidae sp. Uapishka_2]